MIADMKSRMNTNPTAPKIGAVVLMNTNALLHTAESPKIKTQSRMAGLFLKSTDSFYRSFRPFLSNPPAIIRRWTSEVPSQIRSTLSSL